MQDALVCDYVGHSTMKELDAIGESVLWWW
jgi:hypothetical protein